MEEKAQYEAAQKQKQEEMKLVMRERMAEIANREAEAKNKEADIAKKGADTEFTARRTQALDAAERVDDARASELLSRIEQQDFEHSMQKNAASSAVEQQIDRLLDAI